MGKSNIATKAGHCVRQAGFTLVELAVVMIIIGLLIGGVLKGQELITNAQVTGVVSQVKGIDAAITTFRDTYASVPGDMINAQARLPNCNAGTNCLNGNGNNVIGANNSAGTAPAAGSENVQIWRHLGAGDLINGVDASAVVAFGQGLPEAAIGGGYFIGAHPGAAALPGQAIAGNQRGGNYIALTGAPNVAVGAAGSNVLRSSQAARIDRKMDDGDPAVGSVIAASNAGGCNAAAIYDEQNDPLACSLYFRIQQ